MRADDPRHGTGAGYDAERRAGLPYCARCRAAAARYEYDRRIGRLLGQRLTTPSIGTARRVQALVAAGWSFRDIGTAIGMSHDHARKVAFQTDTTIRATTAARFLKAYMALGAAPPPTDTPLQRKRVAYAKTTAARNGWVTAERWLDIEDPTEKPDPGYVETRAHDDHDPVVVDRILGGDSTLARTATRAERVEVVARWRADGRSLNELERLTSWEPRRYVVKEAS